MKFALPLPARAFLLSTLVALGCMVGAATAAAANSPPVISGTPPTSATVAVRYSFRATASDADGNALRFSIVNKPAWATFDAATGTLRGTPSVRHVGSYPGIRIKVTDGRATRSLNYFSIRVRTATANRSPTISGSPATRATVGSAYAFQPAASDPDGHALVFSIQNRPAWAAFSTATGRLSGTPSAAHAGTYGNILIRVSDGQLSHTLPAFSITVGASVNRAPTISGSPSSAAAAGLAYAFQPSASDPDGNALTFSIANRPSWAAFNSSTGRLSGTPGSSLGGVTFGGITISVSDGAASASLAPFSITIGSGNRPPVISGAPATSAAVGLAYAFQPTASDPDGNTLTYSIANRPTWATFNASTGRLSGTPGSSVAGTTYSGIAISVSDGTASAALAPFAITIARSNRPPVISGTPATSVTASQAYSFQPTASDPDGNTLTYSIANRPTWATFNSSTGRLSGTPAGSLAGTRYSGITISVSDGTASVSLAPFSIAVAQPSATGSATLSWTPPRTNTDGTPLIDLGGYRVHYGTVSRSYDRSLSIPNAGLTSVVIENLASGTWYFAVKALTAAGIESDFSQEASKTIP